MARIEIRGAYILWPDDKYIDKLLDAGITHLLIADSHTPPSRFAADYQGHYHPYNETLRVLKKYHKRATMILVPNWHRNYEYLPKNQQFHTKDGTGWSATPCPTSEAHFKSRFFEINKLYKRGLIHGLIWDIENYEGTGLYKVFTDDGPKQCYCKYCKGVSMRDQYARYANLWKKYNSHFPIRGEMPYTSRWYISKFFDKKSWWFCEKTYDDDAVGYRVRLYFKKWKRKKLLKPCYGVWTEQFSEKGIIKNLQKIEKIKWFYPANGWWLYTWNQFRGKVKFEGPDAPTKGPLSDQFFADLKRFIN